MLKAEDGRRVAGGMVKKYAIQLSAEERAELHALVSKRRRTHRTWGMRLCDWRVDSDGSNRHPASAANGLFDASMQVTERAGPYVAQTLTSAGSYFPTTHV